MEKVRIGIIGTGFTIGIAANHARAIQRIPRAELTAIYDIVPGRAGIFAEKNKLSGVKLCESLEELFASVDAVSVCTPNYTHMDLAVAALEAGKHVIVEKPFALSYEDGLRALEAKKKHPDLVAMTVFNYREQIEIQMMKRIIDSGKLGKIVHIRHIGGGGRMWNSEGVYLEWRMKNETSGTGAMSDFGVHMLDLTDYLLHDQIGDFVEFTGMTSTLIRERYLIDPTDPMGGKLGQEKGPVTNDDVSSFSAVSESGALASFQTGRLVGGVSLFEVAGTGGVITRCSTYPRGKLGYMELSLDNPNAAFRGLDLMDIDEDIMADAPAENVDHTGVLREFVDCILEGKQPVRDFARGVYIQKLIDNFSKAAREGTAVKEKVSEEEIRRYGA